MTKQTKLSAALIDQHVGTQMRLRRQLLGLSQTELASVLGLTFQQIQKYEKGTNRVAASRLYVIAQTLHVPLTYFYERLRFEKPSVTDPGNSSALAIEPEYDRAETMTLLKAYYKIKPSRRRHIFDLITSLNKKSED